MPANQEATEIWTTTKQPKTQPKMRSKRAENERRNTSKMSVAGVGAGAYLGALEVRQLCAHFLDLIQEIISLNRGHPALAARRGGQP